MRVMVKAALAGEEALELLEEIRTVLRRTGANKLAQIRRLAGCPKTKPQGRGPARDRFLRLRCSATTAAGEPCGRYAATGHFVCGAHGSFR
jgi:hypothetical protein